MRRLVILIVFFGFAALGTQAPEFAQQYRQRLAGAVDELQMIVKDFDALVAKYGISRQEGLDAFSKANSRFLAEHGMNLSDIITRYERLKAHLEALEGASPIVRPALIARSGESAIINATWDDYRPAAPLGQEGWLYGALSGLLGFLGLKGGARMARGAGRLAGRRS